MANTDYASQMTSLYNRLVAIESTFVKLSKASTVNTMQTSLQNQLNSIAKDLDNMKTNAQKMQLAINDILIELRGL
jgi:Holliday junction resolvasome RuvABC endonuclease subunit